MIHKITLKDLYTEEPRWCSGCGNYIILSVIKKFIVDNQISPSQIFNVSGIGCSGRTPNYINTNSLHGIHGRAIPLSFGLSLANEGKNKIFIHAGDGDALSIGGNHLIHGINKNFNCVFIIYDNQRYALTKNQTSSTSSLGEKTTTNPFGVDMLPLNIPKLALGLGASFVALTADFYYDHLYKTVKEAYKHNGFSIVHVTQNCSYYSSKSFNHKDFNFLIHKNGIILDKKDINKLKKVKHNPCNLKKAFELVTDNKKYLGILYKNSEKYHYDKNLISQINKNKSSKNILNQFKI
jgi:2-oxoglutarate ferredoxin oxidoreductase subunit beta